MADNFTQTSNILKFTTSAAADYLFDLLDHPNKVDIDTDANDKCCAYERENEYEIWVYSEDFFDSGMFIAVLEKFVDKYPNESGLISVSYSCSKPRVSEFGGYVIAYGGGRVKTFDPLFYANKWLIKRTGNEEATTD